MSRRALRALEFDKVLAYIAGFAVTDAGRKAVLAATPATDPGTVRRRLAATGDALAFMAKNPDWSFPDLRDPTPALNRLGVDGSVLAPADLAGIGTLLAAGRLLRRSIAAGSQPPPSLEQLGSDLLEERALEAVLARTADDGGQVLDTASRELKQIRARLAGAHKRVVSHLESLLARVGDAHRVQGASVTIREGRYVMPVRREAKRSIGGYVHDESATGATVYVEPPSAIAMMNRIRELERAEAREIQRVLRRLTDRCRPLADALDRSLAALVEMDRRVAMARAARSWEGSAPAVADGQPDSSANRSRRVPALEIRRGRHPLLVAAGAEPVPFDLALEPGEGIVVVTGPNAGGKTVFLKAAGLAAALSQSGIFPPVAPGTRLPVFDSFFADVGDQQSIADSLSTFSAHLRNLKETLRDAGPRSLVLIDEPGTGTDPKEGEAMARALVETLAEAGCTAIITSHMGRLKQMAAPGNRIVNASLAFDSDQLVPTYQFVKGRPGRSYGLSIARGLGFPARVLDRAEAYRDRAEARLDTLLASIERKEKEADHILAEAERERDRATKLRADLEEKTAGLRRMEREQAARARAEARKMMLDARKEVDAAIAAVTARVRDADSLAQVSRRARRAVEEAAAKLVAPSDGERESERSRAPGKQVPAVPAAALAPGTEVQVAGSKSTGILAAVQDGQATVALGSVRIRVPAERVFAVSAAPSGVPSGTAPPAAPAVGPDFAPSAEIDLRGCRVDEAELALVRAVDEASVAGLGVLRVVHGKGTGALRAQVARVFSRDARIEDFRPGAPAEGGYGVTVAKVR